jgi:hypothetical protein
MAYSSASCTAGCIHSSSGLLSRWGQKAAGRWGACKFRHLLMQDLVTASSHAYREQGPLWSLAHVEPLQGAVVQLLASESHPGCCPSPSCCHHITTSTITLPSAFTAALPLLLPLPPLPPPPRVREGGRNLELVHAAQDSGVPFSLFSVLLLLLLLPLLPPLPPPAGC